MEIITKGQEDLQQEVRNSHLCTTCGACVNLCPYHFISKDKVVRLHACDIKSGKCYAFCPRTPADLLDLRKQLFAPEDLTSELGAVKKIFHYAFGRSGIKEERPAWRDGNGAYDAGFERKMDRHSHCSGRGA